jgi:hypothetical protein
MRGLPQAPGNVSVASLILLTAAPRGRGTSASQQHTHTHTHTRQMASSLAVPQPQMLFWFITCTANSITSRTATIYHLYLYCLPSSVYPSNKYDSGLFVSLLRNDNPKFEEKYMPGTRVERINPGTNMLVSGTVMDIPLQIQEYEWWHCLKNGGPIGWLGKCQDPTSLSSCEAEIRGTSTTLK